LSIGFGDDISIHWQSRTPRGCAIVSEEPPGIRAAFALGILRAP